jgi:hypothetical protein
MRVRDVAHDRWQRFFDDFTHLHAGEHVNVELIEAGVVGARRRVHDRPLTAVAVAGHEAGMDEFIEIIADAGPGLHAVHRVERPETLVVAEEENGQPVAVQVVSKNGEITIIRFEPPRENFPEGFTVA